MEKFKCCFCKRTVKGYGNDPWPKIKDDKSQCCDICNLMIVVPERLKLMRQEAEHD